MAIQISGTPVIDNSRNLVNVNRIFTTVTSNQTTNKTLSNREFCNITTGGLIVGLPTVTDSPSSVGWEVAVGIATISTNTIVGRNGQNIMGLAEDLTIDYGNVTVSFVYSGQTYGWRIV